MKHKLLLINNQSTAAKAEKLLNEGWTIKGAYGTANVLCLMLVKSK